MSFDVKEVLRMIAENEDTLKKIEKRDNKKRCGGKLISEYNPKNGNIHYYTSV